MKLILLLFITLFTNKPVYNLESIPSIKASNASPKLVYAISNCIGANGCCGAICAVGMSENCCGQSACTCLESPVAQYVATKLKISFPLQWDEWQIAFTPENLIKHPDVVAKIRSEVLPPCNE
jgi:hypothetical protein